MASSYRTQYRLGWLLVALLLPILCSAEDSKKADRCDSRTWKQGFRGEMQASELRKRQGCRTFLYFTADYCAPCKLLKKELFSRKEFFERLPNVTKVELQLNGDWQERDLARSLGVKAVPTFFVLREGEEQRTEAVRIGLHKSNKESNQFEIATLDEAIALIAEQER